MSRFIFITVNLTVFDNQMSDSSSVTSDSSSVTSDSSSSDSSSHGRAFGALIDAIFDSSTSDIPSLGDLVDDLPTVC